ncbi:MAG: hypothetical protein RR949_07565 [Oscillospiraceae bacterium]
MTEKSHCGCGCEDHHHESPAPREHTNHCSCGCEEHHEHEHENHHEHHHSADVTENQAAFLRQLCQCKALPIARYVVTSSAEESFQCVALSPVFLRSAADEMPAVKEAGAFLSAMEQAGLLTLDYDMTLGNYPYDEYKNAALFAHFQKTVAEGAGRPGFLGDTAGQELGSMALTDRGLAAIGEEA